MSEQKAINIRCFCFECEAEGRGKGQPASVSKSASPAIDHEEKKHNKPTARKSAGALDRLLFGT